MTDLVNKYFKKKFALTCMFWVSGTYIAIDTSAELASYTAFTTIVLGLFKASDVADKKLNGGHY